MSVSHLTLKRLAALVWYIGSLALFLKGGELARNAQEMNPTDKTGIIVWISGSLLGVIKTYYIFIKSNRKNLARIDGLDNPRIWEFYRIGFFFALATMITVGALLSRQAEGNYTLTLLVGILDISIGTALFLSSYEFWKQGVLLAPSKRD